jgi:hypothetical protein
MLASMLQNRACGISSRPVRPNSWSGLKSASPNRPSVRKLAGSQPDFANEGRSSVYPHTANPAESPANAPARVAPRQ